MKASRIIFFVGIFGSVKTSAFLNGINVPLSITCSRIQTDDCALKSMVALHATKPIGGERIKSKNVTDKMLNERFDRTASAHLKELRDRHENHHLAQSDYDEAMAHCVACDEWELVLDVVDMMKSAGLRQEKSSYSECLKSCLEASNAASASSSPCASASFSTSFETEKNSVIKKHSFCSQK